MLVRTPSFALGARLAWSMAIACAVMIFSPAALSADYYVAPNGSDLNSGTISSPFASFAKAYSLATAGTTIYMRGGVYAPATQLLLNKSGVSGSPIRLFNYPGEVPVIDGINMSTDSWTQGAVLRITGNWNHVKGLELKNGPEFGAAMDKTASNNIFERLNVHRNGRLSQWQGKGIVIFDSASNNLILNCDSHHNRDINNTNADGFQISTTGSGTVLRGNRAWRNSDDGYDLFNIHDNTVGGIYTLDNNWAWENGYDDSLNRIGDGNGFKLGGRRSNSSALHGGHKVQNCVAWNNPANGFDDNAWNNGGRPFSMFNNTAYNNGYANFAFTNTTSQFKNNVSVGSSRGAQTKAGSDVSFNSWTLGVTADSNDFISTNFSIASGPRNSDGSLPDSGFLRLAAGSDLIDKGYDVGLPYSGSAPDLGAHEANAAPIDSVPPSVPASLSASPVSSTQINLSWAASSDNQAVAGYTLLRNGVAIADVSTTVYSDSGLSAATSYSYAVRAYDANGNTSALSSIASASTLAAPSSGSVNLANNPGFEQNLENWSEDWGNSAIVTRTKNSGTKSLRIGKGAGGRAQLIQGIEPGATYSMIVYARVDSSKELGAGVGVSLHSSSGAKVGSDLYQAVRGTSWVKYTIEFNVPAGVNSVKIWAWKDNGPAFLYVDDFSLTKK
jgi:hypothetical protein